VATRCAALFSGLVLIAFATRANPARVAQQAARESAQVPRPRPRPARESKPESAFARLAPIEFYNVNTRRRLKLRLYDHSGKVDETTALQLDTLLCDSRDRKHWRSTRLDRRTLQLVYRTAYHFNASEVQVVSAYRRALRRREGMHAKGKAIDFRIPGVKAATLAAYLRTLPRVGVGVYTHPKTQFVHLDVRERSFHWLDASPPRRRWRERNISSKTLAELDATYSPSSDWPEGLTVPATKP